MKILYIFRSLAVVGGVEKILVDKMNYLSQIKDYEITLITYEQGNHPIVFPLSSKIKHIDLNILFYKRYQYNVLKRSFIYVNLKKQFKKDITKLITDIHPDFVICTTYSMLEINILSKLTDRSKIIIESHSARKAIGKTNIHENNFMMKLAAKMMDRNLYKQIGKCHALITLTNNDAEEWKDIKEAVVIPNMLDYYPEKIDTPQKKGKHIISAGRLTKQKGYDLLLKAWQKVHQKHPDWILDIYGKGEDYNILMENIEEMHLQQVVYIHPPTMDIYSKYMESDFYVMSSRWEGFGLVLAEAMSCGIPCVAFNCPHGPSDIIRQGQDGILVENGNIDLLAEKIVYLIEHEDIRLEMGKKARESAKRFLPQVIMPQWEILFKSLISIDNKKRMADEMV